MEETQPIKVLKIWKSKYTPYFASFFVISECKKYKQMNAVKSQINGSRPLFPGESLSDPIV